jgi:hypothetical protein
MASEEEMDPLIPVELVAQHTPTSAYVMTLTGLPWETCYFESSYFPQVKTIFFFWGGGAVC